MLALMAHRTALLLWTHFSTMTGYPPHQMCTLQHRSLPYVQSGLVHICWLELNAQQPLLCTGSSQEDLSSSHMLSQVIAGSRVQHDLL